MQSKIIDLPHSIPAAPVRPGPTLHQVDEREALDKKVVETPSGHTWRKTLLASTAIALAAVGGIGWFLMHMSHSQPSDVSHLVHPAEPPLLHPITPAQVRSQQPAKVLKTDTPDGQMHDMMAYRDTPAAPHAIPSFPADAGSKVAAGAAVVPALPVSSDHPALPPATVVTHLPALTAVQEVGAKSTPILVPDAADRASRLQAAPLSPQEQVQVLNLVTEEAALIRQQREQLAELSKDQQSLHSTVDRSLADFTRRLTLREAGDGVAAAAKVPMTATADTDLSSSMTRARQAVATATSSPVQATSGATTAGPHSYRIQAASPSLAMLSDLHPAPGTSGLIQLQIGDMLPGYGRVLSIGQRGTAWVIRTEGGTVQ